ncbi:unnamed protein product [Lupinus luteus]|uniref:Uncharacterized protein n=1 Tax=Lupinus luteus TaxID=3873 RepID=A0AAV1Y5K4_LUPLU
MYEKQENNMTIIDHRTTTVNFSDRYYLANHAQLTWFSDEVNKNVPTTKMVLETP